MGVEEYGDPALSDQPFSVQWSSEKYNQFLIGSGDLRHWLIVKKAEIIGESGDRWYSKHGIPILASSLSCQPYSAQWYRRQGDHKDPWVSVRDHGHAEGELMVYGGDANSEHSTILTNSGGMSVWIRNVGCSRSAITGDIGSKNV